MFDLDDYCVFKLLSFFLLVFSTLKILVRNLMTFEIIKPLIAVTLDNSAKTISNDFQIIFGTLRCSRHISGKGTLYIARIRLFLYDSRTIVGSGILAELSITFLLPYFKIINGLKSF